MGLRPNARTHFRVDAVKRNSWSHFFRQVRCSQTCCFEPSGEKYRPSMPPAFSAHSLRTHAGAPLIGVLQFILAQAAPRDDLPTN
jgi:hypothetical protein